MNRFQKKILTAIRQSTPLLALAEQGVTPDGTKQGIIDVLAPYFENKDVLKALAVECLAPEAVRVSRLQHDQWAHDAFVQVLQTYRTAARTDQQKCFETCAFWNADILKGLTEFWSISHLEVDKCGLPLEEFKSEAARNLGGLIEGCLHPHLRELLAQVRVCRREGVSGQTIGALDLGTVVDQLHGMSGYPHIFEPPPWVVRLSQWRNMANHHSFAVRNGEIIGHYGRAPNIRAIRLTRVGMMHVIVRIASIHSALGAARAIFLCDNQDQFTPSETLADARDDDGLFHLATAFATQGFELVDFEVDESRVSGTVHDRAAGLTESRAAHAMQFVFPLWCRFPRDTATIRYLDSHGNLRFVISAKGDDCKAVLTAKLPFEELAARVSIVAAADVICLG